MCFPGKFSLCCAEKDKPVRARMDVSDGSPESHARPTERPVQSLERRTRHTQGDANTAPDKEGSGQPSSGWSESGSLLETSPLVSQFNSLPSKLCVCAPLYIPFIS